MRFRHKKLPRIAGNLLHLVGRPGLMPRYSLGMGVRGFPLTSALVNHYFQVGLKWPLKGLLELGHVLKPKTPKRNHRKQRKSLNKIIKTASMTPP